ncbi:hypothetical protein HUJ05_001772 [Dendroctonus ponderosae]|nr:hypothetical protein HUJ05_001772 [Dendroctonus ponderosae]
MSEKRSFMSGAEKEFSKELACEKSTILECKKSDAVSISKNKQTWVEVANDFNSHAENSKRSVDQLRKCYENMKSLKRYYLRKETPNGDWRWNQQLLTQLIMSLI